MQLSNKILSISGAGVAAEPGDATVLVSNVVSPTMELFSPLSSIITTPPTSPLFFTESHLAYGVANQGASAVIVDTVVTRLGAGMWRLQINYCRFSTLADTVATSLAGNHICVMLRKDAATGSVPIIIGVGTTSISSLFRDVLVNLPSDGWEIRFRLPSTIAADSAFAACAVHAAKLS